MPLHDTGSILDLEAEIRSLRKEVTELKAQQPSYFKDKIFPSLVVAAVVGLVGVYGTHVAYGPRLTAVEQRTDRIELQLSGLREEVQSVAVDVAFIRGNLTNPPKP